MDITTITKLVRNVSMIIVIPTISYMYLEIILENSKPSIISMFPIFIIGFIHMGLIRSIGDYGIQNSNLAEILTNNNQLIINIIKSIAEYSLQ